MDIHASLPKEIPIESLDLCSLLCNILDNAIEACEQITSISKNIYLMIYTQDGTLIINEKNSKEHTLKTSQSQLLTTKQNYEQHGFGLIITKNIVEKYQGSLNIHYDDNTFTITTKLLLRQCEVTG